VFTGIIEATASIIQKTDKQLVIERPAVFTDLLIGSSIAVSGVCLSVISFDDTSMTFDVMNETWDKSKLGLLQKGDLVNLERACLADTRLDGHVVQGHCEGVGRVQQKMKNGELTIKVPDELNKFFIQKGSIAIDGVSLTISSIEDNQIGVALVPHTLDNTTLGSLNSGDSLNIETDVVGRYLYAFSHEEAAYQG
tara:strand:- start:2296 stop:2880 length:585 start_codon:yes stop_codon:yes gene_type:complete